jgi:REP element-mobilizing transposase RayT
MGRPLRTQGGEDWHFITAKSNPGLSLFRDTEDYSRFISQLSQWHERHQVELAAYVLLPDHYHLLARFPAHNASRAMQWLNVSYGHWHQHRHEVKGHLFSRRFEVLHVQNAPACLACASLYLHLHPVRTMMGLSGRTGYWLPAMLNGSVAKARKHLVEFRWSSLNAWLHPDPRRSWLRPPPITDYADLIKTTLGRGLPQSPEQAFAPGGDCRKKAASPAPRSSLPASSTDPRPLTPAPAPFRPAPAAEFRQEFLSRTLTKVLSDLRSLSSPASDSSSLTPCPPTSDPCLFPRSLLPAPRLLSPDPCPPTSDPCLFPRSLLPAPRLLSPDL